MSLPHRFRRALGAFALALLAAGSSAQSQTDLRWAGMVFDAFTLDGVEAWSAEDGGRIRHRDSNGVWSFATVPDQVKDTLRRVFFLEDGMHGWAVGQSGWVLGSADGGATWAVLDQVQTQYPPYLDHYYEDLFDVHFLDQNTGFLLGLHGIWFSVNGGTIWNSATLLDVGGGPLDVTEIKLYSLDVVEDSGGVLGLAVAEPGLVLRSTDGSVWQVVWDIRSECQNPNTLLSGCELDICLPPPTVPVFEPWDVQISRHPTQPLALMAGGVGLQCGLIFASADEGSTWTKEFHECQCSGTGCKDCPNDPLALYTPGLGKTWRHQSFKTLYGVAIFDGTNGAVVAGYNGQHAVRTAGAAAGAGVWQDRSSFSQDLFNSGVDATVFPLLGATAGPGSDTKAFITGEGGHVRVTTDAGQIWSHDLRGEPFRIRDVFFFPGGSNPDDDVGWQVGQFSRLAKTIDGGKFWLQKQPTPMLSNPALNAITFSLTNTQKGAAVGDLDSQGQPTILYTDNNDFWQAATIFTHGEGPVLGHLFEVDWSGDLEFWAVGALGTIFHSLDGGASWFQFVPPSDPMPGFAGFHIESASFRDTSIGIFTGRRSVAGVERGVAYRYILSGGTVQWTDISPVNSQITVLADVDVSGDVAYAVGEKIDSGVRHGVVLRSTGSGGNFGIFTEEVFNTEACDVGFDLARIPVVNEVEIAPNGDVWVGGECGRVWMKSAGGNWIERKTHTDSHVLGMSFAAADRGYLGCHRQSQTQQSVVRIHHP
jgi:photosystem II stability/assembly factor-like uncharacterized protein